MVHLGQDGCPGNNHRSVLTGELTMMRGINKAHSLKSFHMPFFRPCIVRPQSESTSDAGIVATNKMVVITIPGPFYMWLQREIPTSYFICTVICELGLPVLNIQHCIKWRELQWRQLNTITCQGTAHENEPVANSGTMQRPCTIVHGP